MPYKSGICWACQKRKPVDSHHLRPLEYAGDANGEQVLLCKSCHSLAHYEAEYYYKNGQYQELHHTAPKETDYGQRMRYLTNIIVKTKLKWEDQGRQQNDQRRMSQISWDDEEELAMAHAVKRALKLNSLERAIKFCVYEVHKALQNKGKL